MNKHERRAYDAGRKARELYENCEGIPTPCNGNDLNPFLEGILKTAWQSGWDSLDA